MTPMEQLQTERDALAARLKEIEGSMTGLQAKDWLQNKDYNLVVQENRNLRAERDQLCDRLQTAQNEWTRMRKDLEATVKERDQLRDKLTKCIGIVQRFQPVGSPPPTDEVGTVAWIVQSLAAERDAAQKAGAEMRGALLALVHDNELTDQEYQLWKHAVSTNHGTGYLKAESLTCCKCGDGNTPLYCLNCTREGWREEQDVQLLAELLNKIVNLCNEPKDPDKIADIWELSKQALAHWEKVRK